MAIIQAPQRSMRYFDKDGAPTIEGMGLLQDIAGGRFPRGLAANGAPSANSLTTTTSAAGMAYDPGSALVIARDGPPLVLNRVGGDGQLQQFRTDGVTQGSISISGSTTSYNTSSDYRLKKNLAAITDACERLKAAKVYRGNFISNPETTLDMMLAHEVAEVVPESVTGAKDGAEMQQFDASKLVPLLVATCLELIGRVEALE